jgi:hypothetical protein
MILIMMSKRRKVVAGKLDHVEAIVALGQCFRRIQKRLFSFR